MTEILQAISTLGFPIACTVYLFYENHSRDEKHKEEMDKLSTALNNNTLAITKLAERLNYKGGE